MFILTTSNQTPVPKRPIREAYPDHEATVPDICILNETNINSAIVLNSKMLRQALLANQDVTKKLLGITVTDATKPVENKEVDTKKTPRKPSVPRTIIKPIEEETNE